MKRCSRAEETPRERFNWLKTLSSRSLAESRDRQNEGLVTRPQPFKEPEGKQRPQKRQQAQTPEMSRRAAQISITAPPHIGELPGVVWTSGQDPRC